MYDVNPLGPLLHLKDLETKAASPSRVAALTGPRSEAPLPRAWLAASVRNWGISLRLAAVRAWSR